jgi:hypothetical protein
LKVGRLRELLKDMPDEQNLKLTGKKFFRVRSIVGAMLVGAIRHRPTMTAFAFYSLLLMMFVGGHVLKYGVPYVMKVHEENHKLKQQVYYLDELRESVEIVKKRTPAVGGAIELMILETIEGENLDDLEEMIANIPETDWAIWVDEKVLNHGLEKYEQTIPSFIYPVARPDEAFVSSEYGYVYTKYWSKSRKKIVGYYRHHRGFDIVCKTDRKVVAVSDGVVCKVGIDDKFFWKLCSHLP